MDPSIFMGITEKVVTTTDDDGNVVHTKVYTRGLGGEEVKFEELTDADFPEPDPIPIVPVVEELEDTSRPNF